MIFILQVVRLHQGQPTIVEVTPELDDIAQEVGVFLFHAMAQPVLGWTDAMTWSEGMKREEHGLLRAVHSNTMFLYRSDVINPPGKDDPVYFVYASNGNESVYTPVMHVWEVMPKRLADYFLNAWEGERSSWADMFRQEHARRWPQGVQSVEGESRFERDIL